MSTTTALAFTVGYLPDGTSTVFQFDLKTDPFFFTCPTGAGVLSAEFDLFRKAPTSVRVTAEGATAALSGKIVTVTFATPPEAPPSVPGFEVIGGYLFF